MATQGCGFLFLVTVTRKSARGWGCMLIRHFLALVHHYLFLHGRLKSGFLSLVDPS